MGLKQRSGKLYDSPPTGPRERLAARLEESRRRAEHRPKLIVAWSANPATRLRGFPGDRRTTSALLMGDMATSRPVAAGSTRTRCRRRLGYHHLHKTRAGRARPVLLPRCAARSRLGVSLAAGRPALTRLPARGVALRSRQRAFPRAPEAHDLGRHAWPSSSSPGNVPPAARRQHRLVDLRVGPRRPAAEDDACTSRITSTATRSRSTPAPALVCPASADARWPAGFGTTITEVGRIIGERSASPWS